MFAGLRFSKVSSPSRPAGCLVFRFNSTPKALVGASPPRVMFASYSFRCSSSFSFALRCAAFILSLTVNSLAFGSAVADLEADVLGFVGALRLRDVCNDRVD